MRIEATVATLAPELRTIAPVRSWQMGREEEIAYAREHGIPVKGGTEVGALLDRRQPLGALLGGPLDRGSRATRPRTTSSSSSPGPRRRLTSRRRSTVEFEAGVPVALDGERLELVELLEARRRDRRPPRGRDRRPHRGPDRRPQGPRHLRGAGGGDPAHRPPGAGEAGPHDPPEPVQGRARPQVGLPRLRRPLVGAAAHRPRRLHGGGQHPGDRDDRPAALQRQRPGRHPQLAERRLRRRPRLLRRVGRALLAGRLARLHRALVAAVAARPPDPRSARRGRGRRCTTGSARSRSASRSPICAAATGARSGSALGLAAVAVGIAAYLATRNVPEG